MKERWYISLGEEGWFLFVCFSCYLLLFLNVQYDRNKVLLWDKGQVALLTDHNKGSGFFKLGILELGRHLVDSIHSGCVHH